MKAFYLKSLFAAALAVTLSSCEKKAENFENLSEKKDVSTSEVVYPLVGTEISNNILPKRKLPRAILEKGYSESNIKVKLIDTVCEEYLQGTKMLDISSLTPGAHVMRIKNNELTISTNREGGDNGFIKLNNGPKGWWTHWNYNPYTESEYPNVLFLQDREGYVSNSVDLYFDKEVTTFGFEIAPNANGQDRTVSVDYKEEPYYRDPSLFSVQQTISTPSGARLIAVKSERGFRLVRISLDYIPNVGTGFAITNIRYALAK